MYMKKISYKSACFLTLLITAMFMLYGCNSKSPVSSSDSENINSYNSDLMHSSYNKNENDIYSFVQVSGKLSRPMYLLQNFLLTLHVIIQFL